MEPRDHEAAIREGDSPLATKPSVNRVDEELLPAATLIGCASLACAIVTWIGTFLVIPVGRDPEFRWLRIWIHDPLIFAVYLLCAPASIFGGAYSVTRYRSLAGKAALVLSLVFWLVVGVAGGLLFFLTKAAK
jgi:hypothetical protein